MDVQSPHRVSVDTEMGEAASNQWRWKSWIPTGHQSLLTSHQQVTRGAPLPLSKNGNNLGPWFCLCGASFFLWYLAGIERQLYKCIPFCYTAPFLVVPWLETAGFCQQFIWSVSFGILIWVSGFFSFKSGMYKAKRKSWKLTPHCSSDLKVPSQAAFFSPSFKVLCLFYI